MANKIRQDLKDISNTINYILGLADYFSDKAREWTKWWNDNNTRTNIYQTGDKGLIQAVEQVYASGVETAGSLSELLPKINSIKHCPRLKNYVSDIRKRQRNWIADDEKLLSRCKKIISEKKSYGVDFSDVELMMRWHKEQLKILKSLDSELAVIEKSERYKIEEQKQLREPTETEQKAKPIIIAIIVSLSIISVFVLSVWYITFAPFTWIKNHPHSPGIQASVIFLIPCLIVGYFKPNWRKWCWGSAALALLVGLLSLL